MSLEKHWREANRVDAAMASLMRGNGADGDPWAMPIQAPLKIVRASSFADTPSVERRWVWRHWMPTRTVTGLGGPPGVAKSTFAQQLCTHAVTATAMCDSEFERCNAMYLTCEDDIDELHRRQEKINAAMGIEWVDVDDLHLVSRVGEDSLLVNVTGGRMERTPLYAELDQRMGDLSIGLLPIDLASDVWNGNENDRQQVNRFVKAHLAHLALRHEASVVPIYHPSKSGEADGTGTSGSTAWEGSFRSRLYLVRPEIEKGRPDLETDERYLKRLKANYAALEERSLWWTDHYLSEREAVQWGAKETREMKHDKAFMTCLAYCTQEQIEVSPSYNSTKYFGRVFPNVWMKMDGRHKRISRKQFEDAYLRAQIDGKTEEWSPNRDGKGLRIRAKKLG